MVGELSLPQPTSITIANAKPAVANPHRNGRQALNLASTIPHTANSNPSSKYHIRGPLCGKLIAAATSFTVITACAPVVPGVTEAGANVAVAPVGNPVADNTTAPVNVTPNGAIVIGTATEPPCPTANAVCGAAIVYAVVTVTTTAGEVDAATLALPE